MQEKVLVFNADIYNLKPFKNGFLAGNKVWNEWHAIVRNKLRYENRQEAENCEAWKQVIPYCLVQDKNNKVFCYERGKKGGESRLHNLYSVGVGGHINPKDNSSIFQCAEREVREELGYLGDISTKWFHKLGLLYDDSNAVGRVHFGAVLVLQIPFCNKEKKWNYSREILNPQWVPVETARQFNLENWSKLALEMLS